MESNEKDENGQAVLVFRALWLAASAVAVPANLADLCRGHEHFGMYFAD